MFDTLNGLFYIGKLTQKYTKEYDTNKGTKGTNYNFKFEYMGGYEIIRVPKNVYDTLNEGVSYILPVGASSKEKLDFVSLFVRSKKGVIYTIDGEVVEIPENNNNSNVSVDDVF